MTHLKRDIEALSGLCDRIEKDIDDLAQLRKDAERYRFLRTQVEHEDPDGPELGLFRWNSDRFAWDIVLGDMDTLIDAEMKSHNARDNPPSVSEGRVD